MRALDKILEADLLVQSANQQFLLEGLKLKKGKFQSPASFQTANRFSLSACTGKANEGKLQFFGSILEGLALPTCAGICALFVCVYKHQGLGLWM